MKIPIVIQMQPGENGAAALCMILGYYKRYVPMKEMREICVSSRNGSSPEQIAKAAAAYGLDASIEHPEFSEIKNMKLPLMVRWKRTYYCIIKRISHGLVYVVDPARGEYRITTEKFEELYRGTVLVFNKNASFKAGGKRESLYSLIKDRIWVLKATMVALCILTVLCVILNLAMAKVQSYILDNFMTGSDQHVSKLAIAVLSVYLAMLMLYTLSYMLKTSLINRSSRNRSADSGKYLFKNMFHQPMKFFEQYSAGELMTRIENNIQVDNSIIQSLVPRVIDAVMTLVYVYYLISYNAVLACACFVVVFSNIVLSLMIQEKNAIAARSMATSNGMLNTSILNGMNMIETIKSTGSERSFYNMWYDTQMTVNANKMTSYKINAVSNFISAIHDHVLTTVQLFLGAYFIVHGSFTIGSLSLFQSVLNSMKSSLSNCLNTVNTLQTMRTNIERVNDINQREIKEPIPLPKEEYDTVDKLDGSLSARHITFRYNAGDQPAIDDVSIDVKSGQMVAIVGATGCGKSTLLKILADLYQAQSGEVFYSGKHRNEIPDVVFHSSVTTMDQETVMFVDSVFNNITMWDITIENYEVVMATRDAQIHKRIMKDRRDYGAPMSENGRNFSGGELQRLELARALAHEPTLLFLDEFTSALDALTEDKVIKAIRDKGTTAIIVAHRLSTIVDCDKIYVMEKGKIVQEGTHKELYSQEGLYKDLINMQ